MLTTRIGAQFKGLGNWIVGLGNFLVNQMIARLILLFYPSLLFLFQHDTKAISNRLFPISLLDLALVFSYLIFKRVEDCM
jgi:hypothetical protein